MNELTKQLQEIMVPKAALIAYEYQEGHYASGSHYLERKHSINSPFHSKNVILLL